MAIRAGSAVSRTVSYFILALATVLVAYPFFWMLMSSLKTAPEIFTQPWAMPSRLHLVNFVTAWRQGGIGTDFLNSIKVTVGSVVVMVFFGALAAHGIVRRDKGWAKPVLYFFLIGQMIPAQVVIIPLYLELNWAHLLDSLTALGSVYVGSGLAFTIFLLQGFFRGLPTELYDAAVIDGMGELRYFTDIALPLVRPGIAAAIIFQSTWVWNEFLLALIVLRNASHYTLAVGVYQAVSGWSTDFNLAFAALTIVAVPIMVLFAFFQRYFISGIVEGALKQ